MPLFSKYFQQTCLCALVTGFARGAIESNIKRSLFLADKTAFNYYKDLEEKGCYKKIIIWLLFR